MKHGQLTDYFEGVGAKRLSAVDAEPKASNQHEINTTRKMREGFLGEGHQQKFETLYLWIGDEQEGITCNAWATHYDTRINKPRAAEWRLYYPSNPITEIMKAGDTLFLAKDRKCRLLFIVAPAHSTSEQQLCWLFGLRPDGQSFISKEFTEADPKLDFAARFILDKLGIEFEGPKANELDYIIDKFGTTFPPTIEFSQLARRTLPDVRPKDDPDVTLVAWLEHEEALFRRLERRVVSERLKQGFVTGNEIDVDGFISYSLGVQNRRKSRMGYSLENQIAAVLDINGVTYARGAITEHNHKPDFLFPSLEAYRAAAKGDPCLTLLGAKSTCKDRWRQVLAEAAKIPRKHLLTLEPSISEKQTEQMKAANLQLVVPQAIQETFTSTQRNWLWSVGEFLEELQKRTCSNQV